MVTDNQRREVAARIRELMSECFFLPLFVVIAQAINDCLPEEEGSYALILADLIDRPECSMEYMPEYSGDELYLTEVYKCSECGWTVPDGKPSYCPCCGAEVLDEDSAN